MAAGSVSQFPAGPTRDGRPTFVDVFAGCGGLSLGLLRANWRGLFAIEKDKFAFDTIKANLLQADSRYTYDWPSWLEQKPWGIDEMLSRFRGQILGLKGHVDLLAGGPPCQGFSSAGRRNASDPRNTLVDRYLEFISIVQPKMVLLENVRGITYDFKADRGGRKRTTKNFASKIESRLGENYIVKTEVLRAATFGIPQQRPRFFLIGLRKDLFDENKIGNPFAILRKVRDALLKERGLPKIATSAAAISDLEIGRNGRIPSVDSKGYEAISYKSPRTNFQKAMRDGYQGQPTDTRLAKHNKEITKRFKKIISECKKANRLNVQLSKEMRDKFGLKKLATRVLDPRKVAPTITSLPDDLLHYKEPRTLTVRENARLQTFPDWFAFKGKYTTGGHLRKKEVPRFTQVANAVPPLIAEMFGLLLYQYAEDILAFSHSPNLAA